MPTYDYKCEECENIQEEFHPMNGPSHEISCDKCKCKKMTKQMSGPAGWAKVPNYIKKNYNRD